ncbi:hypothetical protein RIF29_38599 [Crotalaria pallida]|uniref:Uncharacterized protein n=1 Tax=Crotalaria pallida TaxID=3830 RepID=A0AAN9E5U8_CROPI
MKEVGCDLARFRAVIHATVMVASPVPRSSSVAIEGPNSRFEKEKRTTEAKAMAVAVRESLPTSKVASAVKGEIEQGQRTEEEHTGWGIVRQLFLGEGWRRCCYGGLERERRVGGGETMMSIMS